MSFAGSTALVHDWLTVPGGAEEVLRAVWEAHPSPIFTAQYAAHRFPWLQGADVRSHWIGALPLSRTRHYLYAPFLPSIYRAMDLSAFDIVLADSHSFAHHARSRPDAVYLCYYHTPARSLWSPEIDPRAGNDPLRKAIARRLKTLDLQASRNPTYVVANSYTTAERVERVYGRKPDAVVYPPVETKKWAGVERRSSEGGFLMWGRLISYKRYDLAVEAALRLGARLDIVGAGPRKPFLERLAGNAPNIRFHGRLPDEALRGLLSTATAVLFPGYEDFGIVPVESMAAGVPVVAFRAGGVSETVGSEHGVLFDEQSVDSLCGAMEEIKARTFDEATLRKRALEFDRSVFDRRYAEAVEEAVRVGPRRA